MNEDEPEQLCLDWFCENILDVADDPYIVPDSNNPERAIYSSQS